MLLLAGVVLRLPWQLHELPRYITTGTISDLGETKQVGIIEIEERLVVGFVLLGCF